MKDRSPGNGAFRLLGPPVALVLAVLLWALLPPLLGLNEYDLPPPGKVLSAISGHGAELRHAFLLSGAVAAAGLAISLVLGFALGTALGLSRWLDALLRPWTIFLQAVPVVAIAPIIIIWSGPGLPSMITVAAAVALFPIVNGVAEGLRHTPPEQLELLRLLRASAWRTWWHLRLPHSLPFITAGVQVSAGLAVVGAIVGEYFTGLAGSDAGLAQIIRLCQQNADYPLLYAATAAAALLGLCFHSLCAATARHLLRLFSFIQR